MSGARRMALVAAALAIAAAPKSTLVQRDSLQPIFTEARASLVKGDFAAAATTMRRALQVAPGDPVVLFNLAQLEARAGNEAAAFDFLDSLSRQGLGFHPSSDPTFQRLLANREGWAALLERYELGSPPELRSAEAFRIDQPNLFPEGIAVDPRDGTLYVSSILQRKVVRVRPDGRAADFVAGGQDSLLGALGMKVDVARDLLWVAATAGPELPDLRGRSGLWAFDLRTGRLARRWMASGFLNDLAIDRRGRVYVTDSGSGAVWTTSGLEDELTPFLPAGTLRTPNGIDVSADGRRLYVATSGRGITAVDLATKQTTGLAAPREIVTVGIDGLYATKNALIAVQNVIGYPRIVRFALRSPLEIDALEVLETRHPLHALPTTGVIWRDAFYYVPNTHLRHVDQNGAVVPADSLTRPVILRLPLQG